MRTVREFLNEKGAKTERALSAYLEEFEDTPQTLLEAVRYSLFAGGKRLRPALALGAAEIVGGDDEVALPAACGLEMIHTYSLIHDDLPAMDNDALRRGKPTLHKVYGEAMAILAGDAMITMAFDLLAQTGYIRVVHEVAVAAGMTGMVGGQVADLQNEGKHPSLEVLRRIHARKTGALIRSSVRCGALLAGASERKLAAMTAYGEHVGLAFQIADDILDVVGSESALGKRTGGDAEKDKSTYPALVGLDRARELANEAANRAIDSLVGFGDEADIFRHLARYIIERDK